MKIPKLALLILVYTSMIHCEPELEDLSKFEVFTIPNNMSKNSQVSLTAEANKTMVIRIRGNPTTGYLVSLKSNISEFGKVPVITPLNLNKKNSTDDYFTDKHPEGFVGVGGFYYFKFSCEREGTNKLEFENKRTWDTSDATILTVNLTVVNPKKN